MQDFLNSILDFITSEKVAYVLSLIAALYIPVSKIVSSIANKKLEKKILNKDALLKVVKNEYETYLKDTNNIIKEISEKYLEAKETVEKVNNILQKQNEALEIAFNNSNLNRRNFARSYFCGLLIAVILIIFVAVLVGAGIFAFNNARLF